MDLLLLVLLLALAPWLILRAMRKPAGEGSSCSSGCSECPGSCSRMPGTPHS
jgi:hypothetical protein